MMFLTITLLEHSSEPRYKGKGLTAWLKDETDMNRLGEALRGMGSNAIPQLVDLVCTKDSAIRSGLAQMAERLLRIDIETSSQKRYRAVIAFQALGPDGTSAVPALSNLMRDAECSAQAALALAGMGAYAVPALESALHHTNAQIRFNAISALTLIGSDGREATDQLIECLGDSDVLVRFQAAEALGKIQAKPERVIPALTEALEDNQASVRWNAAIALGEFGRQARPSLPKLIELAAKDPSPQVRQHCIEGISRIRGKPRVKE